MILTDGMNNQEIKKNHFQTTRTSHSDYSKICFKCKKTKPISEFYKHKGMSDGRLNKCKECSKKDTKVNRLKNIDYYLEYDKARSNLPKRVNARHEYSNTCSGKVSRDKARKKWLENNLIKRSAHILLSNYIRAGKIIKPNECSSCHNKNTGIHGHHDDYSKPLDVRWLCRKCHKKWHKENGPGING